MHYVNGKSKTKLCNSLTDPSTWNLKDDAELFAYVDCETSNGFYIDFPWKGFQPDNMIVDMCSTFLHYDYDFSKIDYAFHTLKKSVGIGGSLTLNVVSDKYHEMTRRDDLHPHFDFGEEINWH